MLEGVEPMRRESAKEHLMRRESQLETFDTLILTQRSQNVR